MDSDRAQFDEVFSLGYEELYRIARGMGSAFAEKVAQGFYVNVDVSREEAAALWPDDRGCTGRHIVWH